MPIGLAAYGHAPTRPVLLVQSRACNHRNRTTLTPETDLVSLAGCTVRSTRAGAASALVADLVPADLRGTAFGLFNGAVGVAAFPASLLAGLLWDRYGAPAPFLLGGGLALVAAGGMLAVIPRGSR